MFATADKRPRLIFPADRLLDEALIDELPAFRDDADKMTHAPRDVIDRARTLVAEH
jgi:hypothetical protein